MLQERRFRIVKIAANETDEEIRQALREGSPDLHALTYGPEVADRDQQLIEEINEQNLESVYEEYLENEDFNG